MSGESKLLEKLSFKQNMKNIRQVMEQIVRLDKSYLVWNVICVMLSVGLMYGGRVLSAYVVNSVSAGVPYQDMIRIAVTVTVALSLGASVLSFVNKQIDIKNEMVAEKYEAMQQEKLMNLDFSLIDSPKLKDIRERIRKDRNWGNGIFNVFWESRDMLRAFLELIGAVVIGAPMLAYFHGKDYAVLGAGMGALAVFVVIGVGLFRHFTGITNYIMFHEPTREEKEFLYHYSWDFAWGSGQYHYTSGKDVRIYRCYELMKFLTYDKMQTKRYKDYTIWRPAAGMAGQTAVRSGLYVLELIAAYLVITVIAGGGAIPVGSIILYAGCLTNAVNQIVNMVLGYFDISLTAQKQMSIFELLALSDEMYKGALPVEKRSDNEYRIEFRNVSFKYPGSEKYALKNFSMTLRVGERLAIVGRNGSGKTTMIKLLCRLYDPDEGEILVNGVDIRKFRHDEYSKLFSVVFQDYKLLALMLAENVGVDKEYDAAHVEKCLADAGFGKRLAELEHGMESYLYKDYTDDGIEISGGEAQKIAIARSIYKEAPFVLLDEPTAALDPIAESEIYTNFDKIAGDKTAIYISHRLSSCKFCDRIAVFEDGRLVQTGSHDELLKDRTGVYASLWNAQAKYYETA